MIPDGRETVVKTVNSSQDRHNLSIGDAVDDEGWLHCLLRDGGRVVPLTLSQPIGGVTVRNLFACCGFALAMFSSQGGAKGGVVVTLTVVGDDVVAEGSGTLNLDALTFDSNAPFGGAFLSPSSGEIIVGPAGPGGISIYTGITDPGPFGGGGPIVANSVSGSGDIFGIGQGALTELIVPAGYVSGAPLSGKTTWVDVNIGNLDLTPGTYVWTWGTGATADSFTLHIDSTGTPIPEPATFGLFALTGVGFMMFRRQVRG